MRPGTKQPIRPGPHWVQNPYGVIAENGMPVSNNQQADKAVGLFYVNSGVAKLMRSFLFILDKLQLQIVRDHDPETGEDIGENVRQEWGGSRSTRKKLPNGEHRRIACVPVQCCLEIRGNAEALDNLARHPAVIKTEMVVNNTVPYLGAGQTKGK